MTLRENLIARQAELQRKLAQCDIRAAQAEAALRDAREGRSACLGALQIVEELLGADPAAAPPQPSGDASAAPLPKP